MISFRAGYRGLAVNLARIHRKFYTAGILVAKRSTAVVVIQKLVRHVCNTTSNITAAPTAIVIVIA